MLAPQDLFNPYSSHSRAGNRSARETQASSTPQSPSNILLSPTNPWSALTRSSLQAYSTLWPHYRMAAAAAALENSQQTAASPPAAAAVSPQTTQQTSAFLPFEVARAAAAGNGNFSGSPGTSASAATTAAAAAAAALSANSLFHATYPYQLAAAAAMASSQMAELQRTLSQQQETASSASSTSSSLSAAGAANKAEEERLDQPTSTTQEPSQSKAKEGKSSKNPYSIDEILRQESSTASAASILPRKRSASEGENGDGEGNGELRPSKFTALKTEVEGDEEEEIVATVKDETFETKAVKSEVDVDDNGVDMRKEVAVGGQD